jgi:hypothetical protein
LRQYGRIRSLGKKNPVTLVRIVVARKIAVHVTAVFEPNIAATTTNPTPT